MLPRLCSEGIRLVCRGGVQACGLRRWGARPASRRRPRTIVLPMLALPTPGPRIVPGVITSEEAVIVTAEGS